MKYALGEEGLMYFHIASIPYCHHMLHEFHFVNPLPDMPILGSFNSATKLRYVFKI